MSLLGLPCHESPFPNPPPSIRGPKRPPTAHAKTFFRPRLLRILQAVAYIPHALCHHGPVPALALRLTPALCPADGIGKGVGGFSTPCGASIWSGCSVRIRPWPRLPRDSDRLLSFVPMFGASAERSVSSCSSLDPASTIYTGAPGSTGLCVHTGQGSLPPHVATSAGPI